jgi:uridine kinase
MTYEKRQRERARRERKEARAARRDERRLNKGSEEEAQSTEDLMAQFQQLNRDHEAGKIELEDFTKQRDAIFEQLGVPM